MNCVICKHGSTAAGYATVTLERKGTVVVMKGVPAEICANCGEHYLSSSVAERVMGEAEAAAARHAEVEILRYAA